MKPRRAATTIEGTVLLVQESRFQLVDQAGVSHLLTLGALARAEADQLGALARHQARIVVRTKDAPGTIGRIATAIDLA